MTKNQIDDLKRRETWPPRRLFLRRLRRARDQRAYYRRHPEQVKALVKRWRHRHPHEYRELSCAANWRRRGIPRRLRA